MTSGGKQSDVEAGLRTALRYCALAAITMAYGWRYRGTVGHEAGAMLPGALLGMVLCLASGRLDWHRRAAVVGLFAAVGWAWGGSISYMEHTFYVLSASFPDVLYGYTMLFLIGALWAGCGGALLGLALTESRSELECLTRPLVAVCTVFFAVFLYFYFVPEHREVYETITVLHFHDGDWLSATITLLVAAVYWIARPGDRRGTALILSPAVGWWTGYGLLTKLGGLRLAPLHRSESWGGVLGVLIVLILYLVKRENRAALMLCLYGCVGGGLSFALAVFFHNPLVLRWGPFENVNLRIPAWGSAESMFGLLMGLALALGALRLVRGRIAPPIEDRDRGPLDVFSVFVIAVAVSWMNFRRHTARVMRQEPATDQNSMLGLPAESWYLLLGVMVTIPALLLLNQYRRGNRSWAPQSAFGKGAAVTLLLIWVTAGVQLLDGYPTRESLIGNVTFWMSAALATWLLVGFTCRSADAKVPDVDTVAANDGRWQVGWRFVVCCGLIPVVLLGITGLSLAMQDEPPGTRGRLRFGPHAYWRQTARLQGVWDVIGFAANPGAEIDKSGDVPFSEFEFDAYRRAVARSTDVERTESHRWFLKNQYIWLQWSGTTNGHEQRAEVPLQFHEGRLYISWPPHTGSSGNLVLERRDGEK